MLVQVFEIVGSEVIAFRVLASGICYRACVVGTEHAAVASVMGNAVALSNADIIGGGLVPQTLVFGTPPSSSREWYRRTFCFGSLQGDQGFRWGRSAQPAVNQPQTKGGCQEPRDTDDDDRRGVW